MRTFKEQAAAARAAGPRPYRDHFIWRPGSGRLSLHG
jgi:hypothetical protein